MDSIILSDMELCVLALLNNFSIRDMKKILPRNVKNRFKWKNKLYIQKHVDLVLKRLEDIGPFRSKEISHFTMGIFLPNQIYVLSQEGEIICQIRISEYGKFSIQNVSESEYKIERVGDEEEYISDLIGFGFQMFFDNVIYSNSYDTFDKIQQKFNKNIAISEEEKRVCMISDELEKPMWTLEIHNLAEEGKSINIIVWNKDSEIVEFCHTKNEIQSCIINIGTFTS